MIKVERTIIHDDIRNENVMQLETRVIARHMFRIDDIMDSQAIELQTAIGANMLVSEIISMANGFELLPINTIQTFNELVDESDVQSEA